VVETNIQRRISLFAGFLPEIASLYEEINKYKKEEQRLASCKNRIVGSNYREYNRINAKRNRAGNKRCKLEIQAKRIINELIEMIWSSDNPNICALRKDLVLVAKMVQTNG